MNEWVKRSIEIANSAGYLDRLHEIYPVKQEAERGVSRKLEGRLRQVYNQNDDAALVRALLKLDKFPIKDPYVAFLRKNANFIEHNPETVRRIADRIRKMGFKEMMRAIREPKEFNRQMGPLFKRWISKMGYPVLSETELRECDQDIAFLQGSEAQFLNFANGYLGCKLAKGPDFIVKVHEDFVIGEAKFLTDYGGHQNAQLKDALALLGGEEGGAKRVAVLDGVVWIKNSTKMHKEVAQLEKTALTALLLKEFLESLKPKKN